MDAFFDLPLWLLAVLMIGGMGVASVIGFYASRPFIHRLVGPDPGINDAVEFFVSGSGVIYSIAVGLIAVFTWQAYSDVQTTVAQEAAALVELYSDVSGLSDPPRTDLKERLHSYTRFVIHKAWPQQRRGNIPREGAANLRSFRKALLDFEPKLARDQAVHQEALATLDEMTGLRRIRLHNVTTGLPPALIWAAVFAAAVNIIMTLFMVTSRPAAQAILTGLFGAMTGLLLFLIVILNYPFRGDLRIRPAAFESALEDMVHDRL